MPLDEIDQAILTALQADGRQTNADLADQVGLSASACHRRVKALEADGVITGYAALLDADRLGRGLTVIVLATLENQKRETMEAFEAAVARLDHVIDCYLTTGAEDYFLKLQVRDTRDYEQVHREHLSGLPGVARLVSNIAMRTVFVRQGLSVRPDSQASPIGYN